MSSAKQNKITIFAISGSLRANSSNAAVLQTAAKYLDKKIRFVHYKELHAIPPFDDSADPHPVVKKFRKHLQNADGILICAPEYAFGVSGVLKNAIDWTVSSGEFADKPTALITAATGGDKAHAAMEHTLKALSASVPDTSKLLISFVKAKMDENNTIKDPVTQIAIRRVVDSLMSDIAYQYL